MTRSLAVLGLFAFVGCGDVTAADGLAGARKRWDEWGPKSYDLIVSRDCYCIYPSMTGPVLVRVRNGVIESRAYVDSLPEGKPSFLPMFPDVPGLFELISSALNRGRTVDARYDALTGAPLDIDVDHEFRNVDGEIITRVQLRPLK